MINELQAPDPFRAVAYIRKRNSAFIGKDKHYEYHKHLTNRDGKAIPIAKSDFYVDLVIIPLSCQSPDKEIIQTLFDTAISGPDPKIPSELPSCLFASKRQNDLVHFCWDGKPVELKLHQFDRYEETFNFEDAFECLESLVDESILSFGGFDYD